MPERETYPPACTCDRPYTAGNVLVGWRPCSCRGHRTLECRGDTGGCGATHYLPELTDTCTDPWPAR